MKMKNNNIPSVTLYKPSPKQGEFHKACVKKDPFFVTLIGGRQGGKTYAAINQAIFWAMNDPGCLIYWVSPTAPQAVEAYEKFLQLLEHTPFIKTSKGSFGDTKIIFQNKTTISFKGAKSEDNLRGPSVTYMILDECAWMKEIVFRKVLFPMLNALGKACVICTSPRGKNWVYDMYNKGKSGDPNYKSFKLISSDNPQASPLVLEMAREMLTEEAFAQEYMAEFIDEAACFKNIDNLATIKLIDKPKSGDRYWAGVDIALKSDYTVITIMNQDAEVVFYDRFNNITAPVLKERLIKTINLFKPIKTIIEANNQGLPIIDDIKIIHKVRNIVSFNTTSKSKPEIINNLINAFGSSKLKIPNDEIFTDELKAFTMYVSDTGVVKYEAASGMNDDVCISLALVWKCFNQYKQSGYVFTV